ncbi:MAG: hypothetical protein ACOYUZ_00340 [Patescibacteria group bacterium]
MEKNYFDPSAEDENLVEAMQVRLANLYKKFRVKPISKAKLADFNFLIAASIPNSPE